MIILYDSELMIYSDIISIFIFTAQVWVILLKLERKIFEIMLEVFDTETSCYTYILDHVRHSKYYFSLKKITLFIHILTSKFIEIYVNDQYIGRHQCLVNYVFMIIYLFN